MTSVDTSAAGRLLVRDVGTDEVLEVFRSDAELFASALVVAELLRVATRNGLDYANAERVVRRLRLLDMEESLLREAGRLDLPGARVRTADAVHLVSAVRLEQTELLTYDRRQARAAEALGLRVRAPGLPAAWWRPTPSA